MSHVAEVAIAATPMQVWRVLADIEAWPSWSPSIASVVAESSAEVNSDESRGAQVRGAQASDETHNERSAYRVDQPPLPLGLWTITDWQPGQGFSWQMRGASSQLLATFAVTEQGPMTRVTYGLRWTGPMAWMARAAYGPVGVKYADEHLIALAQHCESRER